MWAKAVRGPVGAVNNRYIIMYLTVNHEACPRDPVGSSEQQHSPRESVPVARDTMTSHGSTPATDAESENCSGPTRRGVLKMAGAGLASVVGASRTAGTDATNGGSLRWKFQTGGWVNSSPTIVDGTVYVGSSDDTMYALNAGDGSKQWEFQRQYGAPIDASPNVVDGRVFFGDYDNYVYALDATDGSQIWRFEPEYPSTAVEASPTAVDGTVYVGVRSDDDNLYALDAASGSQEWVFDAEDWVVSGPTVVDGTVYATTRSPGSAYAVNASDGTQEWKFQANDQVRTSPTVSGGTVYFGSDDRNVYALDATNGSKQWEFQTGSRIRSSPTVADGTVYIGGIDNKLYALDATDGSKQWEFQTGDWIKSSPTVAGGRVFVGSFDNTLYAVDAADGSKVWEFEGGDYFDCSPTVVDGTVCIGNWDRNLYAVDAGIDGSSDGSRVRLGTLGHHGTWGGSDPTPDPIAYTVGDVDKNEIINIVDVVKIQRYLAGLPGSIDEALADVRRTGNIGIVDAVYLQQYLAELREGRFVTVTNATYSGGEIVVDLENTGGLGALDEVEIAVTQTTSSLFGDRGVTGSEVVQPTDQVLSLSELVGTANVRTTPYDLSPNGGTETVRVGVSLSSGSYEAAIDTGDELVTINFTV